MCPRLVSNSRVRLEKGGGGVDLRDRAGVGVGRGSLGFPGPHLQLLLGKQLMNLKVEGLGGAP